MSKVQKGVKAVKDIFDEVGDAELVQKVIRALKGESDDATAKIGSGKNLEALKRAKVDAPKAEAPAYPKNIGRDEVNFTIPKDDPGFSMPHPESQVPAIRANNEPAVISKKPDIVETTSKQLSPESTNNTLRNAGIATLGLGGASALMMGGQDAPEQKANAFDPMITAAAIGAIPGIISATRTPADLTTPKPESIPSPIPNSQSKPEGAPQEEAPVEDEYMQMMKQAQDKQNEQDFIDNLLRAGITGGSAIARGSKADYSGVEALQKQNSKPVEDVKNLMSADMDNKKLKVTQGDLDDDSKLRDPNSDISTTLREMLSKLGYPVNDKVSGKQLKDMGINVYNLIGQKEAREAARLNREASQGNMNNERAKAAVERGMNNWSKSDSHKMYSNAKSASDAIQDAILTNDKIAAGTAFMRFAKTAQGDDSVVKSEDMKTLLGGVNYTPAAYASKVKDLVVGKNVTDKELHAMKRIMDRITEKERVKAYKDLKPHLTKAQNSNLDLNEYIDSSKLEEISSGMDEKENTNQSKVETKIVGGKTYKKVAGGWEEVE